MVGLLSFFCGALRLDAPSGSVSSLLLDCASVRATITVDVAEPTITLEIAVLRLAEVREYLNLSECEWALNCAGVRLLARNLRLDRVSQCDEILFAHAHVVPSFSSFVWCGVGVWLCADALKQRDSVANIARPLTVRLCFQVLNGAEDDVAAAGVSRDTVGCRDARAENVCQVCVCAVVIHSVPSLCRAQLQTQNSTSRVCVKSLCCVSVFLTACTE
jgi:hypothetical protein